jgi:hypothetical protein
MRTGPQQSAIVRLPTNTYSASVSQKFPFFSWVWGCERLDYWYFTAISNPFFWAQRLTKDLAICIIIEEGPWLWRPQLLSNTLPWLRQLITEKVKSFIQNQNVNPYFKSSILSVYFVNTGTLCLSWPGDLPRFK